MKRCCKWLQCWPSSTSAKPEGGVQDLFKKVTTLETSLHESQKEAAVSAAVLNLTQEFSAIRKSYEERIAQLEAEVARLQNGGLQNPEPPRAVVRGPTRLNSLLAEKAPPQGSFSSHPRPDVDKRLSAVEAYVSTYGIRPQSQSLELSTTTSTPSSHVATTDISITAEVTAPSVASRPSETSEGFTPLKSKPRSKLSALLHASGTSAPATTPVVEKPSPPKAKKGALSSAAASFNGSWSRGKAEQPANNNAPSHLQSSARASSFTSSKTKDASNPLRKTSLSRPSVASGRPPSTSSSSNVSTAVASDQLSKANMQALKGSAPDVPLPKKPSTKMGTVLQDGTEEWENPKSQRFKFLTPSKDNRARA